MCCCRALWPLLLTYCRDFLSSSHHIKPVMQDYKPLSQLITQGMVRWLHAAHSCPSNHWVRMVAHTCLGTLLIVDLTDPLMDANAANAIFTVCVCGMWMLS